MNASALFETVASEDYLSIFEGAIPKYKKVVDILELSKRDVAGATGIPVASVRYDDKIQQELKERVTEWATLLNLVAQHFQGNSDKAILWFKTTNPLFGNVSPREMIRFGRFKKLFRFVQNALAEKKR